ncbi:MAG: chromosomal replication initiator protein DnaA [Schwartzia sp.]|nr:chromosomal replication initiator protein DnaA [Schwartzia sp. (in: firmicutes)]MBO6209810.1 chromosomal replication initiator protein DnaA [Schwartzia sp. (in: firmicutes)]MBO6267357.1 chromosomal replication initiator protein DnaA [Synergistaceae bacterium]MBO6294120.1 chromosomal replication initiator protein DnaA [Schwartzia sp. (in: firmicutes)]
MEQKELQSVWEKVLENFRNTDKITASECQRWLNPIIPLTLDETSFSLGVPNDFSLHYIKDHYIPFIKDAVFTITGKAVEIDITTFKEEEEEKKETAPEADSGSNHEVKTSQASLFVADKPIPDESGYNSHFAPVMPGDHSSLKEKYTFDNFVRGNSNQMAHASALAVAELTVSRSPQLERYNPLFLYSGVGLGKTHLMHAIGNYILEKSPNMRVLYISSERFLNDFIASIREGKPEEFQRKYRSIDVLLVDDVQFLYTKERTQEEFFHTFNALYDADKTIILSADRHPREIKIIEDRLRSRFEWGMTTDIKPPDLETRMAILQQKAMMENLDIPNDVFYFIANRVNSNIRELEGALTRVIAQASFNHKDITVELASKAMEDVYPSDPKKTITLELIQDMTASYFKITTSDLLSKKRTQSLAQARQVAMYLCRELTNSSLPQIGERFGGRDHTTVMHAYNKILKQRQESSQFNETINELIEQIQKM